MKRLSEFTDEQLKFELERRAKVSHSAPTMIENPDWSAVIERAKYYVEMVKDGDEYRRDTDFKQYLFEEVMTTLYGKRFFNWVIKMTE